MKKIVTVTIDATFGSEFQQEYALKSLSILLDAWKLHIQMSHKKNIIITRMNEIGETTI